MTSIHFKQAAPAIGVGLLAGGITYYILDQLLTPTRTPGARIGEASEKGYPTFYKLAAVIVGLAAGICYANYTKVISFNTFFQSRTPVANFPGYFTDKLKNIGTDLTTIETNLDDASAAEKFKTVVASLGSTLNEIRAYAETQQFVPSAQNLVTRVAVIGRNFYRA